MNNLNEPAINRTDIKPQPSASFVYEGICICGSVLYKWTSTDKLFCHNCAKPRKNLKK